MENMKSFDDVTKEEFEKILSGEEISFCLTYQGNFTSLRDKNAITMETKMAR